MLTYYCQIILWKYFCPAKTPSMSFTFGKINKIKDIFWLTLLLPIFVNPYSIPEFKTDWQMDSH
jgi:hypothetical protein